MNGPDRGADADRLRQALSAIRTLRQRNAELAAAASEPIAIVSMACRFPGGADSPEAFWQLLCDGRDAAGPVPADRWDNDAWFSPDAGAAGRLYTREAAFLDAHDQFDPELFGISPREAARMDPQQRLLLETAWEALERAAWSSDNARDRTGVFIGSMWNEYANAGMSPISDLDAYVATGSAGSFLAGRLSSQLGLCGPSLHVDTACSSSLVAVHLACESLRKRECDRALVGGVNVMIGPELTVLMCRLQALSPDGRCKTFDASADGYGRGEGCGMIAIRRLSDAVRDADPILAVLRGAAFNHNGSGGGLTVPSAEAQREVIARALQNAGVEPRDVSYVEAHGTGTSLGDPIELRALWSALRTGRGAGSPLVVASVKTNIGHLEGAAGIAGLIKTVLCLQHGKIPPHLHLRELNPQIVADGLPIQIPTAMIPWPDVAGARLAGVSSFGLSGINCHVLLEERAPAAEPCCTGADHAPHRAAVVDSSSSEIGERLLLLAAGSESGLRRLAERYQVWVACHPDTDLADMCYTTAVGRRRLQHRAVIHAPTRDDALAGLQAVERGGGAPAVIAGAAVDEPAIAWLFPGQGAQFAGMGRELYAAEPVFRAVLDDCDRLMREIRGDGLLPVLWEDEARLGHTEWTQPALFAVEMALAELWLSWGVQPDIVAGHSVGQFAAACVAGVLTREQGLHLIAERGRLMSEAASGSMFAVFASADDVRQELDRGSGVSIAAFNQTHVVISGESHLVEQSVRRWEARAVRCVPLRTSHAFHSALMEPCLDSFQQFAGRFQYRSPTLPLVCNVTGAVLHAAAVPDAAYWRRQAREPVQWERTAASLQEAGCRVLLELGPAVLTSLTSSAFPDGRLVASAASLQRGRPADQTLRRAIGQLHVAGVPIDFKRLHAPTRRRQLLPTYPFERKRYWFGTQATSPARSVDGHAGIPPLPQVNAAGDLCYEIQWRQVGAADHNRDDNLRGQAPVDTKVRSIDAAPSRSASDDGQAEWWIVSAFGQAADPVSESLAVALASRKLPFRQICGPTEIDDLFQRIVEWPSTGCRLVWSVDFDRAAASVDHRQELTGLLLRLARLVKRTADDGDRRCSLFLVTRGGVAVDPGDALDPRAAAVWGAAKVLRLEHPDLFGRLIDLPLAPTQSLLESLASLVEDDHEDLVALRSSGLFVPRLTRLAGASVNLATHAARQGTVLITGGLGAIGLAVAAHLVRQGTRNLVLTSRREASADARAAIERIEAAGGRVCVMAADVSCEHDVRQLIDRIGREMPLLSGIVHAAGTADLAPFADMTADDVQRVWSARIEGARNLACHTQSAELEFFACISSIASVWGSRHQAPYAAANAFLDAFVASLRQQGVNATSINFGPWLGTGLASDSMLDWLKSSGLTPLDAEQSLVGCDVALLRRAPQTVVAGVDWPRFLDAYQLRRKSSFFFDIEQSLVRAGPCDTSAPEDVPLIRRLAAAGSTQQKMAILTGHVRLAVAGVLGQSPEKIDVDRGFFRQGMDSLMALELRRRLERDLGRPLPATLAMDAPCVTSVVEWLLPRLAGAADRQLPDAPPAAGGFEPVAIVGMGCRFPGAKTPDEFWQLLHEGRDAIREVPADRWEIDRFFDPDPDAPGKVYTRSGGYLDQVDQFDAGFFDITPREAARMDPQQRLVLEVAWEALEHAGISPRRLAGSSTGVYLGVGANEYAALWPDDGGESIDGYFATGNALNAVAGRVAFFLGLQGPALAIDTACSSSLVAVHQAVQGLRTGDCDVALAGGVNALLRPESTIAACRARMLAPDGRCKTFDAAADGYVRGEGCGVLVLRRLADAIRDGDRVLAVIRGTATNQDGASSGLTVPHGPAQERVIAAAVRQAGVSPHEVCYVEAHGTGTNLGDPIEIQAAAHALAEGRAADRPLLIGSVKTNIGHLESAAGAASLIKVVLSLQHGTIPRQLNFEQPNPHIPWDELPVRVATEAVQWDAVAAAGRRLAGISGFGFTGTNAHLVVEGVEDLSGDVGTSSTPDPYHVLVLSAESGPALRALATQYCESLEHRSDDELAAICATAFHGRNHFPCRAALVVHNIDSARDLLELLATANESQAQNGTSGFYVRHADAAARATVPETASPDDVITTGFAERQAADSFARAFLDGRFDRIGVSNAPKHWLRTSLPTYPFQRKRYWIGQSAVRSYGQASARPLLGLRSDTPNGGIQYLSLVSVHEQRWLQDHQVYRQVVIPGASFAAMVLQAVGLPCVIQDLEFEEPVVLRNEDSRWLQLVLSPALDQVRTWSVHSRTAAGADEEWVLHAHGKVATSDRDRPRAQPSRESLAGEIADLQRQVELAPAGLFDSFGELGLECGRCYQSSLRALWRADGLALGELVLEEPLRRQLAGEPIHPVLLDVCNCVTGAFLSVSTTAPELYIPLAYDRIDWLRPVPERFFCLVRFVSSTAETQKFHLQLIDPEHQLIASIDGLVVKRASRQAVQRGMRVRAPQPPPVRRPALLENLKRLPHAERTALLTRSLQQELQAVLELDALPDVDRGFSDLGVDSLLAVELRARLQAWLGDEVPVPTTIVYEHPTIAELAGHLAAVAQEARDRVNVRPNNGRSAPADELLAEMSEQEAEQALLAELKETD